MSNNLEILEEFDTTVEMQTPHLMHRQITEITKQRVALSILSRRPEDVLLMNSTAFEIDYIFAGLRLDHIEYLAKNAPKEYKEVILKNAKDGYFLEDVFAVIKKMDESLSPQEKSNQARFLNVVQYIKDNQEVFEF